MQLGAGPGVTGLAGAKSANGDNELTRPRTLCAPVSRPVVRSTQTPPSSWKSRILSSRAKCAGS